MNVIEREAQNIIEIREEVYAWFNTALPKLRRKALRNLGKGGLYTASIRFPKRFIKNKLYEELGMSKSWLNSYATDRLSQTYGEPHVTTLLYISRVRGEILSVRLAPHA